MENKNIELLNNIYQNADMGLDTLDQINGIATDAAMRKLVEAQMLEYKSVRSQAERRLSAAGQQPKTINGMLKTSAKVMINLKTLTDKSPEHIAPMVIKGSVAGVIEITQKLRDCAECDDDIKNLGYKLLWTEQKNADEMKHFL